MPMMSMKEAYEQAKALYDQGSYRAAAHASGVLYKQVPHHPPVVALYVGSLLRIQQYKQGIRIATRSLRHITHKPHRVSIITQLCDGLTQSGQLDEAIELVAQELVRQPEHLGLASSYAHLLVVEGRRADAIEFIDGLRERGLEGLGIASVFGRAVLRTDRRDEAIEWVSRLLEEQTEASDPQLIQAYNSLGHLLDKAKRYDDAMESFKHSNALATPDFSEARNHRLADSIIANWTPDRFKGLKAPEPFGARPVFIVGMPRSGTTLTEQIIDAHPKGFGCGELGLISEFFSDLARSKFDPYATGPDEYDPVELAKVARAYRQETAAMAGEKGVEVIVDKAPMNFNYLGMIALAFPDARIVHCARDPRDNCLSCFFQLLNTGHTYSFDLHNCGLFYRHYRKIYAHYHQLLAGDPINMTIFENDYEGMVEDQEKRTRELLAFIGLDFDPACLDFHKSGRVAVTLSNEQVRQPIYQSSTKRYEHYAKHLGALVEALGDVIEEPHDTIPSTIQAKK